MTKNMLIALITLVILALGIAFKFDAFRVLSVLAFILAVDLQIIATIRAIKLKKLMEDLNK